MKRDSWYGWNGSTGDHMTSNCLALSEGGSKTGPAAVGRVRDWAAGKESADLPSQHFAGCIQQELNIRL